MYFSTQKCHCFSAKSTVDWIRHKNEASSPVWVCLYYTCFSVSGGLRAKTMTVLSCNIHTLYDAREIFWIWLSRKCQHPNKSCMQADWIPMQRADLSRLTLVFQCDCLRRHTHGNSVCCFFVRSHQRSEDTFASSFPIVYIFYSYITWCKTYTFSKMSRGLLAFCVTPFNFNVPH